MAIRQKHEQAQRFRRLDDDYGMESLMLQPYDADNGDETLWFGAVKYPYNLDMDDFDDFQELVLDFVSELRRELGGENWEVFLSDNEEPATWDECRQCFS